jgi:PAS domain S-box-containing protein
VFGFSPQLICSELRIDFRTIASLFLFEGHPQIGEAPANMIRIFLIDHALEEPQSIARMLRASLTSDFSLSFATTYREILEGFRSQEYDVCLIDSAAGNGPKLFAQARSLGWTAPIVLVTSNDAREVVGALRDGVADCLIRNELTVSQIERSICSVVEQARGNCLQLERERRYLGLLANASDIIYTHDLAGNFTSMNQPGEQLLGFSQLEILNLNITQIVVAEYRSRFRKLIERTLDAQTQTFEEIVVITKYGHQVTLEVGTHPIYQQGKPIEIQGIAANPSERFAAESRTHRRPVTRERYSQPQARLAENHGRFIHFPDTARSFSLQESL